MFFSVDSRLRENDDGDAGGRSENAGGGRQASIPLAPLRSAKGDSSPARA